MSDDDRGVREACEERDGLQPEHIKSVRLGHGANCSSVGSVIDTLFVSAAVGGAIFAAICAALRNGDVVRVVGSVSDPDLAKKPIEKAGER